eukprot:COSAG06_NODE_4281_length_4404_cov_2.935889_4_plen_45_part_00
MFGANEGTDSETVAEAEAAAAKNKRDRLAFEQCFNGSLVLTRSL